MNKPKVLHYYSSSIQIGGPLTYINTIINSELNKAFDFDTCYQMMAPKGINLPLLNRMCRQIKRSHPDLLHVHGLQSEGLYGLMAGRMAGCKKILVTVHGLASDTVEMNSIKRGLYRYIVEPFTLRNADFVYCVCNYAADRSVIRKNARKLLDTIYTSVLPEIPSKGRRQVRDELNVPQDRIVGIIVSRIVKDKGYCELSKAINELYQTGEDRVRFCMVGEGGYAEELRQNLKQEISKGYVQLCGRRVDVTNLLSASDFFVLPSWHENFPISLLEAAQVGLPAVATNVGGIPEIIEHERTGLLIPENNPMELSKAIRHFVDHSDRMIWMGKNAKEKMEASFSLNQMTEKIHQVYSEIIH